jgi:hypothetical protein
VKLTKTQKALLKAYEYASKAYEAAGKEEDYELASRVEANVLEALTDALAESGCPTELWCEPCDE